MFGIRDRIINREPYLATTEPRDVKIIIYSKKILKKYKKQPTFVDKHLKHNLIIETKDIWGEDYQRENWPRIVKETKANAVIVTIDCGIDMVLQSKWFDKGLDKMLNLMNLEKRPFIFVVTKWDEYEKRYTKSSIENMFARAFEFSLAELGPDNWLLCFHSSTGNTIKGQMPSPYGTDKILSFICRNV